MPEHLDHRTGRGRWVTILQPTPGTLWTNDHVIGFQQIPGHSSDAITTLIDQANKLITIPIDQRFDTLIDDLCAIATKPEHANLVRRNIRTGILDNWDADQGNLTEMTA